MKLSKIKIKNFRTFEEEKTIDIYDFTSLIGANNCGKSTILKAIELFLNQEKPIDSDWCKTCTGDIEITATFSDIQEWERDLPGVAGIIQENEIKLKATYDRETKKPKYEAFIQMEIINDININDNFTSINSEYKEILKSIGITTANEWKAVANKERFKQHLRDNHPGKIRLETADWTSENISIDAALKQAIPHVEILPAVRDASEETKPQAKTTFGKLLNTIILPAIQSTQEFSELKTSVAKLSAKLRAKGEENGAPEAISKMVGEITERMSELVNIKAILDISEPDTEKFLGSNAILKLDDGTETEISYQGHGAQRALIFSLIDIIANQSNQITRGDETIHTRATILLFEEPELYLHPHLMKRLKESLIKISQKHSWQVIISTHSPFLIDIIENPKSLVLLRKTEGVLAPNVSQLKEIPFSDDSKEALRAALDFHPTVTEAFFAQRVILVEGDTEIAVLKHTKKLYSKYGIDSKKYYDTTVVSCGGKWTIPAIAQVMTKLNIPYRIIHDNDAKGRTEKELAEITYPIDPYKANNKIQESVGDPTKIFIVKDTFEDVLWERSDNEKVSSKDKPYKSWKRINELIETEDFETKFPELKKIYEFAFNW
ncbi:ATP-dependent nuclease [Anaerotignum sp.]|uniref:ATP-dependent nuclease n=1 Tax=Anaerotignum sp. TaxID=2039241 RepID=UPI0027146B8A|nr:AAA family ATPase [Anaerotignum sp.]